MEHAEIHRRVQTALAPVLRGRYRQVRVRVDDAGIALDGTVETLAEKRAIVNAVRQVEAHGQLRDGLTIVGPAPLSDVELTRHAQDAIAQDAGLRGQDISAAAFEGVVTLSGRVDSYEARCLASLAVWWVPGVSEVRDRLEQVPAQTPTAADVRDVVVLAFERDVLVPHEAIAVSVDPDFRVTLVGAVPTEEARRAAEFDAYCIQGVTFVDNRLAVRSM